jgi:hypothetical protein
VSTGTTVPVQPLLDPRAAGRALPPKPPTGAAATRNANRGATAWWPWRSVVVAVAALGVGLLVGLTMGAWLGWRVAVLGISPGTDEERRCGAGHSQPGDTQARLGRLRKA